MILEKFKIKPLIMDDYVYGTSNVPKGRWIKLVEVDEETYTWEEFADILTSWSLPDREISVNVGRTVAAFYQRVGQS